MNITKENVVTEFIERSVEKTGWMFYVINPKSSTYQFEDNVPNYINEVLPLFVSMIIIEALINIAKGKTERFRLNEAFASVGHGVLQQTSKVLTGTVELIGYQWLYERRFIDLDWTSPWTWWAAAIGADFTYYWFHRAVHELSFFWASHQVHHSSEDYNLTTALRQSMFQRLFSFGFQQPLALLGVPLPALLVHIQFNLLYQFWIHTEVVSSIGPLEWIFNTASHHRVHHGMNKWCLDKNYAGVLIIWDRMFGTFQEERFDDPIVYGLVNQPQKMNTIWGQLFYFNDVFEKAASMKTWSEKFKALFYGPGWFPGTERLGDMSVFPDKTPSRPKYDPSLPRWIEVYLLVHFFITMMFAQMIAVDGKMYSWVSTLLFIAFVFVSIGNIGALYDGWRFAPVLEAGRCLCWVLYITYAKIFKNVFLNGFLVAYFTCSTVMWTCMTFNILFYGKKLSKLD